MKGLPFQPTKRSLGLLCLLAICIAGFLSIRGAMPFIPIFGASMEPTLHSGALLTIDPVDPADVEVGDIIVYNVPDMVGEYYNYPSIIAHRVIEVKTSPSLGFRTKGDNTGEDPFTVRPQDLRGTVGTQLPYLGLPFLFFQSQQGMIFVIIALVLLALFLYGGEMGRGLGTLHRRIFSPVINEEKRVSRVLTRKIESTEAKMNTTEQALDKFASAIGEYAEHLASHTSAIQGLSDASHELKRGAADQNLVLQRLMNDLPRLAARRVQSTDTGTGEAKVTEAARLAQRLEKMTSERKNDAYLLKSLIEGREIMNPERERARLEELAVERERAARLFKNIIKRRLEPGAITEIPPEEIRPEAPKHWVFPSQFPPGCVHNRRYPPMRKSQKSPPSQV